MRRRDAMDAAPPRRRRRATHTIRHRRGAPETPSTRTQVWYKDEGGREKCILLNVSLEDGSGNKIKDRPVQLKCLLEKFSSLDALKEAAFLYCYSKEPWAELDFS